MVKISQLYMLFLLIVAAACTPVQVPQAEAPSVEPAVVDVSMPVPTEEGEPVTDLPETIAVEMTTHTDQTYGYTFDYPSAWMLDAVVYGSRAPGGYQITSWQHEPGMIAEVLPDGTVVNIVLQLWDPKADLPAFIEQRKFAWVNSGIEVIFDESVMLAGEKPAREFVTVSQGERGYTLFTTLGENYLVVSGTGDLEAVRSVAWSLR
jgi:hypothetical protein